MKQPAGALRIHTPAAQINKDLALHPDRASGAPHSSTNDQEEYPDSWQNNSRATHTECPEPFRQRRHITISPKLEATKPAAKNFLQQ